MAEQAGFLGRFQQGQELTALLRTTTAAGVPDTPLYHPQAKIYRDGAPPVLVDSFPLPADQQGIDTGAFRLTRQLTGAYGTAGRYLVVFAWTTSAGAARTSQSSFTLLPGGSPDGATISLFCVRRPNASYLIRQTDSGLLIRGKNPR